MPPFLLYAFMKCVEIASPFRFLRPSGGFYWHNIHTKFCKDLPNDTEVDMGKHIAWRSRHQLPSAKNDSELNLLNTTHSNITTSCLANLIIYWTCSKFQSLSRSNIHPDEHSGLLRCDTVSIGNYGRFQDVCYIHLKGPNVQMDNTSTDKALLPRWLENSLKCGNDRLSRNVVNYQSTLRNMLEEVR